MSILFDNKVINDVLNENNIDYKLIFDNQNRDKIW